MPPQGHTPAGISQIEALRGKASAQRAKRLFWGMGSDKVAEHLWANYAVADRPWNLLSAADAKRVEFCDNAPDARETKDVATEKPEVLKDITAKLEAWEATLPARPSGEIFSKERVKQEPQIP
jgi:hypothetical protein